MNSLRIHGIRIYIVLLTFFLPLFVFFIYGIMHNSKILFILAAGLLAYIGYLFSLRSKLVKIHATNILKIQNFTEKNNLLLEDIKQEECLISSLEKKVQNFSQLTGFAEKISFCLNLEDTISTLLNEVASVFGFDQTSISLYVFHMETKKWKVSSLCSEKKCINEEFRLIDVFDQWMEREMHPLLVEDTVSDYRFGVEIIKKNEKSNIFSLMSVPLIVEDKNIGILRVDALYQKQYQTEDLRVLTAMGELGALAIENAQLYERVETLAIRDGLTGLYLRAYFMKYLSEEIAKEDTREEGLFLIFLDLDYFKKYNDKYGHMAGDIVLKTVADVLMQYFSEVGQLVCRYGGEEFCVVLSKCSKVKAAEHAENIRQQISKQDIILRREKTHVYVSIGISSFSGDVDNIKDLIHKADMALYQAKENGRNRVCVSW